MPVQKMRTLADNAAPCIREVSACTRAAGFTGEQEKIPAGTGT
jgi:hypothetical protein